MFVFWHFLHVSVLAMVISLTEVSFLCPNLGLKSIGLFRAVCDT